MDVEQLKNFVRREFLFDPDAELGDDQPLFPDIVDSLGLIEIVEFVQTTYGVVIDRDELVLANFRTINDVARMVRDKAT